MNDAVAFVEREPGPSWERPNWPVEELDELNLGLDPTQATIEKVKAAAGITPVVKVHQPNTLPTTEFKSKRITDLRRLHQ